MFAGTSLAEMALFHVALFYGWIKKNTNLHISSAKWHKTCSEFLKYILVVLPLVILSHIAFLFASLDTVAAPAFYE